MVPSLSILAEPPVAVVDTVARRKGTGEVAEAYLEFLYTPEAQELIAQAPLPAERSRRSPAKYAAQVPDARAASRSTRFGGWKAAQAKHFADGGVFDQIYQPGR